MTVVELPIDRNAAPLGVRLGLALDPNGSPLITLRFDHGSFARNEVITVGTAETLTDGLALLTAAFANRTA
jgi:hypothetical protein